MYAQIESLEKRALLSTTLFGTADSAPTPLFQLGNESYFTAVDNVHGQEIWRTDGTAAGTELFIDATPGIAGSAVTPGVEYKGKQYFLLNKQMWCTDGTRSGTVRTTTLQIRFDTRPVVFKDHFYFVGIVGSMGEGLYKSDGTQSGTHFVAAMKDPWGGAYVGSKGLVIVARNINVNGSPSTGVRPGYNLFFSDGTAAGSVMSSIHISYYGYVRTAMLGDDLIVGVTTNTLSEPGVGKVYRSDGTVAGTTLIDSRAVYAMNSVGNRVIYTSYTGSGAHQYSLWTTDGTSAGTHSLIDSLPGLYYETSQHGNIALLTFTSPSQNRLLRTDGTAAGTSYVTDLPASAWDFHAAGGQTYFSAGDGDHDDLWRLNDNATGGIFVKQLPNHPRIVAAFNDKALFTVQDPATGEELWISDGTDAGTFLLKDINTLPKIAAPTVAGDVPRYVSDRGETFYSPNLRFTGSAPAGATVVVFASGTELARGVADEDGVYLISLPTPFLKSSVSLSASVTAEDGTASPPAGYSNRVTLSIDASAPTVVIRIDPQAKSFTIESSEPIKDPLNPDNVIIQNRTTGDIIGHDDLAFTLSGNSLLTVDYANAHLEDGEYLITMLSVGVRDRAENSMQADASTVLRIGSPPATVAPLPVTPPPAPAPPQTPLTQDPAPFSFVDGVLTLTGSNAFDQFYVAPRTGDPSKIVASIGIPGLKHVYSLSQLKSITIQAGDGGDRIFLNKVSIPSLIFAGGGNDTVWGSQGPDRILGGVGRDWISGGAGNDTLYGNEGNDRLFGGAGKDYIVAGAGADVVRGGAGRDRILASRPIDDFRSNKGDLITLVAT